MMKKSESQPLLRGKFITSEARAQVGKELARTHFNVGREKTDYATTNERMFPVPPSDSHSLPQAVSRLSHISLGPGAGPLPETESEWRYKAYDMKQAVPKPAFPLQEDLRKHHFALGNSDTELKSTARTAYTPQLTQVDALQRKDVEQLKQTIRKHADIFGKEKMYGEGLSRSQYTPKTSDPGDWKKSRDFNMGMNSRASVKLGSYPVTYESVSSHDFLASKPSETQPCLIPKIPRGVSLGTDRKDLTTVSQAAFAHFPYSKSVLNQAALKDLQKTHFSLGSAPAEFTSTNKEEMAIDLQAVKHTKFVNKNKESSITLGKELRNWGTTYADSHVSKSETAVKPLRDRSADKESHFTLGSMQNPPLESVTKSEFHAYQNPEKNQLSDHIRADIRNHHFIVGTDKGSWNLDSQGYGETLGKPGFLDPKMVQDMKKHHFQYGSDIRDFRTTSKPLGQSQPYVYSSLDSKTLAKLKGSSAVLGNSKDDYISTYKNTFLWVQPEADSDFKLTMR